MNKKHTRNLFAFGLISFLWMSAMEGDGQENEQKRVRVKRKKVDVSTAEDTYPLWLYKKASQSTDSDTLSNGSLAFLQEYMPKDIKQTIANTLYEDLNPYFISKLLCKKPKPHRLVTHSHPPYVTYKETNEVTISCDHSPQCRSSRNFSSAGREYIHTNGHHLSQRTYHPWKFIQRSSKHNRLTPPRFMLKTTNNNLISVHSNNSVYEWPS